MREKVIIKGNLIDLGSVNNFNKFIIFIFFKLIIYKNIKCLHFLRYLKRYYRRLNDILFKNYKGIEFLENLHNIELTEKFDINLQSLSKKNQNLVS